MKTKIVKILMILFTCSVLQTQAGAATLKVIVGGIQEQKGKLQVVLFDSSENWLRKGVGSVYLDVDASVLVWEIEGLKEGNYAVYTYQDLDENDELNRGTLGKPTEPYGFSNGARGLFGPAKWKDAMFVIKEGANETRLMVK